MSNSHPAASSSTTLRRNPIVLLRTIVKSPQKLDAVRAFSSNEVVPFASTTPSSTTLNDHDHLSCYSENSLKSGAEPSLGQIHPNPSSPMRPQSSSPPGHIKHKHSSQLLKENISPIPTLSSKGQQAKTRSLEPTSSQALHQQSSFRRLPQAKPVSVLHNRSSSSPLCGTSNRSGRKTSLQPRTRHPSARNHLSSDVGYGGLVKRGDPDAILDSTPRYNPAPQAGKPRHVSAPQAAKVVPSQGSMRIPARVNFDKQTAAEPNACRGPMTTTTASRPIVQVQSGARAKSASPEEVWSKEGSPTDQERTTAAERARPRISQLRAPTLKHQSAPTRRVESALSIHKVQVPRQTSSSASDQRVSMIPSSTISSRRLAVRPASGTNPAFQPLLRVKDGPSRRRLQPRAVNLGSGGVSASGAALQASAMTRRRAVTGSNSASSTDSDAVDNVRRNSMGGSSASLCRLPLGSSRPIMPRRVAGARLKPKDTSRTQSSDSTQRPSRASYAPPQATTSVSNITISASSQQTNASRRVTLSNVQLGFSLETRGQPRRRTSLPVTARGRANKQSHRILDNAKGPRPMLLGSQDARLETTSSNTVGKNPKETSRTSSQNLTTRQATGSCVDVSPHKRHVNEHLHTPSADGEVDSCCAIESTGISGNARRKPGDRSCDTTVHGAKHDNIIDTEEVVNVTSGTSAGMERQQLQQSPESRAERRLSAWQTMRKQNASSALSLAVGARLADFSGTPSTGPSVKVSRAKDKSWLFTGAASYLRGVFGTRE